MASESVAAVSALTPEVGEALEGFWASDAWDLRHCPIGVGRGVFRFGGLPRRLREELKQAVRAKLLTREWNLQGYRAGEFNRIVAWLVAVHPTTDSLLDRPIEAWTLTLQAYLLERRLLRQPMRRQLDRTQHAVAAPAGDPTVVMLRSLYRKVVALRAPVLDVDEDIWDVRRLGIAVDPADSQYMLNFTRLVQPWLRAATKRFVRHVLLTRSYGDARAKLGALTAFSAYLDQTRPGLEPHAIDRQLIVDHLAYLRTQGIARATMGVRLVALRAFFDLCVREGWADIPERPLIYREDFPRREQPLPRWIDEGVLQQLLRHLDELPLVHQRITRVLEECGLRISEACGLPVDCLSRDPEGDYFLRYRQPKMHKEIEVPISRDLAAIIRDQQQLVRAKLGPEAPWLFPARKTEPVKSGTYRRVINWLAFRCDVRDATGALFRVHPHGFRHTVGTRLINNDVPQHVVQQFLGHESPEMTARYARIHAATMKQKLAEYRGKVVDITGKIVESEGAPLSDEALWLKRNILAQALPNGICRLPIQLGECPHANACLTCVHFGTTQQYLPVLKDELTQTERILMAARSNGWRRQVEMNDRVCQNLITVITALETGDSPVVTGGQVPPAATFIPVNQL